MTSLLDVRRRESGWVGGVGVVVSLFSVSLPCETMRSSPCEKDEGKGEGKGGADGCDTASGNASSTIPTEEEAEEEAEAEEWTSSCFLPSAPFSSLSIMGHVSRLFFFSFFSSSSSFTSLFVW